MKLRNISNNQTEVIFDINDKEATVLFSYSTPVAARFVGNGQVTFVKTSQYHSRTTSKHVNNWLREYGQTPSDTPEVNQAYLKGLVKG